MSDANTELSEIRKQIDALDLQVLQCLNDRARLALQVARIKQNTEGDVVYYRPEREAQILRQIQDRNSGPLDDETISQVFRIILTACLALQKKINVAFLGPIGTYSHAAVLKNFGAAVQTTPVASIEEVFNSVARGEVGYGVVPIENSSTGIIKATLDILMRSALTICGEIILPVQHCLLRNVNNKTIIKRIYAHEQAFAQCQIWLAKNYPQAEKIAVISNAAAAEQATQDTEAAAIASEQAADIYGLEVSAEYIADNPQNQTRFLVIGQQKTAPSGLDKTSLLISTPHTPGTLIKLLKAFSDHDVNITLIESRPYQQQSWSYIFFIDIEGHQEDAPVKQALQTLTREPILLNILGSYPRASV
jgi:chorismate mutase/prephenate dehydratase